MQRKRYTAEPWKWCEFMNCSFTGDHDTLHHQRAADSLPQRRHTLNTQNNHTVQYSPHDEPNKCRKKIITNALRNSENLLHTKN